MYKAGNRKHIVSASSINENIFLLVYFILTIEYDIYTFGHFGKIMSGTILTWIEISLLLLVILNSVRYFSYHHIMYCFLLLGIIWTYFFVPSCKKIILELFFEGSSVKKIFLLPLACQCIKNPKNFGDKLYKLAIIEGYIHVICNFVWGYGYNEWGVFNYMVYGMALITPTCIVMQKTFSEFTVFKAISLIIFEINIIIYGHRGALLVSAVMMCIFFFRYSNAKRKILIVISGTVVAILLLMFKEQLINGLIQIMNSLGIESRTLEKMLSGDIMNDSERNLIWTYLIASAIKKIPFGQGIGADRLILQQKMRSGLYAHNFIIELIVNYGIIVGAIVGIWILKIVYNSLVKIKDENWYGIIAPMLFSSVFTLLTSSSIYQYWLLWLAIGLYYCYFGKIRGSKFKMKRGNYYDRRFGFGNYSNIWR